MAKQTLSIASPGARFSAFLIDIVFLLILHFSLLLVLGSALEHSLGSSIRQETFNSTMHNFSGALKWISPIYFIFLTYFYQATLGKKLLGLKVITADNKRLTFLTVILREVIGKFISTLVILLGFVWIIFDKERQGWHDKIANTLVVRR